MTTIELMDDLLSSDLCEELSCELAFHPEKMTRLEKGAAELIGQLYAIAHSANRKNSCYHVHKRWRKDTAELKKAMASR